MTILKLSAALLLTFTTTFAGVRSAEACGGYTEFRLPRESAVGVWPKLERDREGHTRLSLGYPKYALSGDYLYMGFFTVVPDRNLRRLERELARPASHQLEVTVEEVRPGAWRVVGWTRRAS
jgi:hypothetical protein